MSIVHHPQLGMIECVRSLRARSIRLVVCRDGTLRLTYPLFTLRGTAIRFAESKAAWIEATRRRIEERKRNTPTLTREEIERLRREARRVLPPMVERLAREHGFKYSALRISSAHTRWGSCSGRNSISLSLYIMTLPEHLHEFIILHELCHTRHHNHSAAFHALLDSCVCGKEKLLNKELRSYHIPATPGE